MKKEVVSDVGSREIPRGLKLWFIVHFVADVAFAIPLFVLPRRFLTLLGWTAVDPITTRMVAAALLGIGIESLLSRNGEVGSYRSMLTLKIIWSSAAVIGLSIALGEGLFGFPAVGAAFLTVFILFNIVWSYWLWRIGS